MAKKLDTIGKKKITIPEIQYITLWVGIPLAIVFCLVAKFCFDCTIPESIAIFAGVIATVAAVYNALHLTNNFNLNEQKYLLDKKLASLTVITEWYKDFAEKTLIIKSFREKYYIQQQMKPDQLIKFINENPTNNDVVAFRKSIRPIFNYFEKISIGIKAEAY